MLLDALEQTEPDRAQFIRLQRLPSPNAAQRRALNRLQKVGPRLLPETLRPHVDPKGLVFERGRLVAATVSARTDGEAKHIGELAWTGLEAAFCEHPSFFAGVPGVWSGGTAALPAASGFWTARRGGRAFELHHLRRFVGHPLPWTTLQVLCRPRDVPGLVPLLGQLAPSQTLVLTNQFDVEVAAAVVGLERLVLPRLEHVSIGAALPAYLERLPGLQEVCFQHGRLVRRARWELSYEPFLEAHLRQDDAEWTELLREELYALRASSVVYRTADDEVIEARRHG